MSPEIWLLLAILLFTVWLRRPYHYSLLLISLPAIILSIVSAKLLITQHIQIITFALLSLLFKSLFRIIYIKKKSKKQFKRRESPPAKVVTKITPRNPGEVTWRGETWNATSIDCEKDINPGEKVIVLAKTTKELNVLPLNNQEPD